VSRVAVVLFHTTNHALRAEKLVGRAGLAARLVPVPRHLSSDCGLCLRISEADAGRVRAILTEGRVEVAGIHPA
jgi:hypothetical protein